MTITVDLSEWRAWAAGVDAFIDRLPEAEAQWEHDAAGMVVKSARPTVPVDTGAARRSVRVLDYSGGAAAAGGSVAVPYFGWLSFGGAAGRNHSVHRAVVPDGRYLWPGYLREHGAIELLGRTILWEALHDAGLA